MKVITLMWVPKSDLFSLLKVFLPDDKKTIKPKSLGGMAGGEKYIVQNILFKFAIDSSNLFQGSHLAPGKVFSFVSSSIFLSSNPSHRLLIMS